MDGKTVSLTREQMKLFAVLLLAELERRRRRVEWLKRWSVCWWLSIRRAQPEIETE